MKRLNLFKAALTMLLIFCLMFSLVACGDKNDNSNKDESKEKVALIMNQPLGDPFANLVYVGIKRLEQERDIETKLVESLDKSEYVEQVRSMAKLGYDPVLVLWDDLAAATIEVAPEFPDTHFIILDSYTTADLDNVQTVVMEPQEATFLAGYLAANKSQTGHIGFVGGIDDAVIGLFSDGYIAGAKYAKSDIKIDLRYSGTFIDPTIGKEIARQMIDEGCDVLFHAANKTGLGVLKACEEKGVLGIGVDMWQGDVAPGTVFWSALKDAESACYEMAKKALDGDFKPGIFKFGVSTGAALYDQRDFDALDEDLQADIKTLEEKLRNEEIGIPITNN